MTEFAWDEDSVAVPSQSAIAVYITEHYDVVLRQRGEAGEPDSIIEVASKNCLTLCEAILREAGENRFKIVRLPDDVIIGRDGNHMHIPETEREKIDKL